MNPRKKPHEITIGEDLRVSVSKGQIVQSSDCREDQQARDNAQRQIAGSLKHVSIGEAGVWGVDVHNHVYYKRRCGCSWTLISGELKQVDVGTNVVWGVAPNDEIYYREVSVCNLDDTSWILVDGRLKHVSVSQKGHVWGVNSNDHIYHLKNVNAIQSADSLWKLIGGALRQISIGSGGVWGVSVVNEIFYREGTLGDPESDPDGSAWQRVGPAHLLLRYVSSGDVIYVVDANDAIYCRVGTSVKTPTGTVWQQIDGNLKQIESISSTFWGVDAQNNVYTNMSLSSF